MYKQKNYGFISIWPDLCDNKQFEEAELKISIKNIR